MTNTTFAVGGDIEVRRLGFGAMRITGPGTWGPPRDRAAARALLRRAVDLGAQLINLAAAALQLEQDEIQAITAAASRAAQRATQAT